MLLLQGPPSALDKKPPALHATVSWCLQLNWLMSTCALPSTQEDSSGQCSHLAELHHPSRVLSLPGGIEGPLAVSNKPLELDLS